MLDVTKSIETLCSQMSIANIIVPTFEPENNVHDFLAEFELATFSAPEDQRKNLLKNLNQKLWPIRKQRSGSNRN